MGTVRRRKKKLLVAAMKGERAVARPRLRLSVDFAGRARHESPRIELSASDLIQTIERIRQHLEITVRAVFRCSFCYLITRAEDPGGEGASVGCLYICV